MGWRGSDDPGEFPTLGYDVADWIETNCVIPDGDHMGEPYILTDEQLRFLLNFYRLENDATVENRSRAFAFRRAMYVRPQKHGKGPLTAALICAESIGPVLFDGWDADGEPVGRPWATPWVQIAAASEDQTANVYRSLVPMIQEGPLADTIPDTGLTRINLPGGGYIEPVTATGRSRLGQRITFAIHDETHSWYAHSGGHLLAETQRRNLAGMGGRSVATTNAWNPAEQSDAQRTFESKAPGLLVDFPPAAPGSINNKRDRMKALKVAYGDSAVERGGWVDLERIDQDIVELIEIGDAQQAERFYLNRIVASSDAFFDAEAWNATARADVVVPKGATIALGFDGSQTDDWTALRARYIDEEGNVHGFTPTFHGKPTIWNPADHDGEMPRYEVNGAIEHLFEEYRVVKFYADPHMWQSELEDFARRYGEKVVLGWPTYRTRPMAGSLERLRTDIARESFTHDGCDITTRHIMAAAKQRRAGGVVVGKPDRQQKIDSAIADTLAHEAAADAIAAGLHKPRRKGKLRVYR